MKALKGIAPILLSGVLFSCVEPPPPPPPEEPIAKTIPTLVKIIDDNAGSANVGDLLTGTFSYSYAPGDRPESVSSVYRWLRNGEAIADATGATYQLKQQDNGQNITFEYHLDRSNSPSTSVVS